MADGGWHTTNGDGEHSDAFQAGDIYPKEADGLIFHPPSGGLFYRLR
jgi:hypothetical protein